MCRQESIYFFLKLGTKDWSKRFDISVFAINVANVWLEYQVITRTAETQDYFYNYLSENMINNTYDKFMIRSAEGRRRKMFDSDDETINDDNPLFGRINGSPRFGIAIHATPNNKNSNKSDGIEIQYLLQV